MSLPSKRPKPRRKSAAASRIKPRRVSDPAHLARVAALPCIVCGAQPVEVHHIRATVGMGQRASDLETLPLCHSCHRTGGAGVAFHAGPREWERLHGTERELLALILERLKTQETA